VPIRDENRARYPADWKAISHRIRFVRAGGRCECAGECGRPTDHLTADGRCRNVNGGPAWGTAPSRVVLTCAHLDHVPEHSDDENLRAYCQGCHLHYDRGHHAETRARTLADRRTAGMSPLFDLPPALDAD